MKLIGKLRSAGQILCNEGFRGVFRAACQNIYSRETFLIYRRNWDLKKKELDHRTGLNFFLAGEEHLPIILEHWPMEFGRIGRDRVLLAVMLRERWAKGGRCFFAECDEVFCGALWTEEWQWGFGDMLGGDSKRMFEYVNVFIRPEVRKLGAGGGLIRFAGYHMAELGCEIGIARVQLDRHASMAMFEKCGFERKGCLVSGHLLGFDMRTLTQNGI